MKRKIFSVFLAALLCVSLILPVCASKDPLYINDQAGLLTDEEYASLSEKLEKISEKYNAWIFIYTMDSCDGRDLQDFSEEFYDEIDLGYGKNRDGVLLVVSMSQPRNFAIVCNGFPHEAINIDSVLDAMESDMRDENFADAFNTFAAQCDYYINGHLNGFPFDAGATLIIALVIGFIIGLISVLVMKSKLKSVRKQNQANVYVRPGSMQITIQNDLFLYRTISRIRKQTNNSSGSGSGSSRSSGSRSF